MKRRDLIAHLAEHDCHLVREGSKHSLYANAKTGAVTTVPRHREINQYTVASICRDPNIPLP
jgi:mRNA interferase HicA